MKKFIYVLLTAVMLISLIIVIPTSASARVDTGFGNWMGYKNSDGTFTVTGCRNMDEYLYDHTLTIPSKIDGMKVTGIDMYNDKYAFYLFDPTMVDTVIMPDTIEDAGFPYLRNTIFSELPHIKKLVLPNNPEFDEYDAENLFYWTETSELELTKLKELSCYNEDQFNGIVYSDGINKAANLTDLSLKAANDSLTLSGFNLLSSFYIGGKLKELTWQNNGGTTLDVSGLPALRKLEISSCGGLKTIKLPASLRRIYLQGCPELTDYTYPSAISSLSVEELYGCPKFNMPVIYLNYDESEDGNGMLSFGRYGNHGPAYKNSKITEVHIDSRRISWNIDGGFFTKMPYLKKFVISGSESQYFTRDGVLYWKRTYEDGSGKKHTLIDLAAYPAAKSTSGDLKIAEDITCIYPYSLDGCKFTSITFPENLSDDFSWISQFEKTVLDFTKAKFRMVKNSSADDSYWYDDKSRIEYYKGNTYRISYQLDGGNNNATNPNSYVAGNIVTLKNPSKAGYTFLGWTRNDSTSGTDYINTTERRDRFKDLTFTAHWKKSGALLATPKISKLENTAAGVVLTWGKVSGAEKYRVFRKTGTGSWTKLSDTIATTYTDKTAVSGTKYYYTIRCISKDSTSYTSSYDTVGKWINYIAAPKISKTENVANGVKITWGKVTGAQKYRVFVKDGTKWKKLADTTATSFLNSGVTSGTKYTYTIRCVSSDGKTMTSGYNTTGWTTTYIATPAPPVLKNTASGIQISWKRVAGAANYRIFRKTGNGKWTGIAFSNKAYVDKTAKNGVTYTYTIRCVSADKKSYTSAYNTKGTTLKCKR